jgi:hypothetical protein
MLKDPGDEERNKAIGDLVAMGKVDREILLAEFNAAMALGDVLSGEMVTESDRKELGGPVVAVLEEMRNSGVRERKPGRSSRSSNLRSRRNCDTDTRRHGWGGGQRRVFKETSGMRAIGKAFGVGGILLILSCADANVHAADAAAPKGQSVNLAKVVTATFLGGNGTEWLTSGAFLPDGNVLVCGVTLDAEVTLRGVKAAVLGQDAPPLPAVTVFQEFAEVDTGKIAIPDLDTAGKGDAVGKATDILDEPPTENELKRQEAERKVKLSAYPPSYQWAKFVSVERKLMHARLNWMQPEATAFMALCSPDLKTVHKVVRFPRGAGSITAAVLAKDGFIYVAGSATDRIKGLPAKVEKAPVPKPDGVPPTAFGCRHTYLAKMSQDLTKVEWVREMEGWSVAPKLRAMHDGTVAMHGPDLLYFAPDGTQTSSAVVGHTRVASGTSINPVNGEFCRTGDWLSMTGREPYRVPRCYIYDRKGGKVKTLYTWRAPFASIDPDHLVADSAIRKTAYDEQGNLTISSWSHGGNSVMMRYPNDIERFYHNRLGHMHGGSVFCIVKVGPDHNLLAGTIFRNHVETMGHCEDGSIAMVHGGFLQAMPNTLSDAKDCMRISVIQSDLAAFRFSSAVPACGTRVVSGGCYDMSEEWKFVTGTCQGRPMLMCLTGAVKGENIGTNSLTPVLKDPGQPEYGGGLLDGYAIVLDLTADKPFPKFVEPTPPPRSKPSSPTEPAIWPAEGQLFEIAKERYKITTRATFRDSADAMWPSFFKGKGEAGGTFTYGTNKATAAFVLKCPEWEQDEGRQDQKVCGELYGYETNRVSDGKGGTKDEEVLKNPVTLRVTSCSPWTMTDERCWSSPKAVCRMVGELQVGSRKSPIPDIECGTFFNLTPWLDPKTPGALPISANVTLNLSVTGKQIGLTGKLAEERINLQFVTPAISPQGTKEAVKEAAKVPELE